MSTEKPLYIFDLDGTVALIDHRRHFIERTNDSRHALYERKPDWKAFYAACDRDQPCKAVIETMERLRHAGADIWFFSGRSDEVRDKTVVWFTDHTSFMSHDLDETVLHMRPEGDYTPDDELKLQWLNSMLDVDRRRLVAVFEDRDRMVKMWRANGVPCFQVAPGEF